MIQSSFYANIISKAVVFLNYCLLWRAEDIDTKVPVTQDNCVCVIDLAG